MKKIKKFQMCHSCKLCIKQAKWHEDGGFQQTMCDDHKHLIRDERNTLTVGKLMSLLDGMSRNKNIVVLVNLGGEKYTASTIGVIDITNKENNTIAIEIAEIKLLAQSSSW